MAEQDIGKRFRFPKGQQRTFIKSCVNRLGATRRRLAEFANVSVRTVTDWKREKFLLPVSVARKLSKKNGVAFPSRIKKQNKPLAVKIFKRNFSDHFFFRIVNL